MSEKTEKLGETLVPFYIPLKFQDLDTKKYFTLKLVMKDAENEDFIASLAKSRGHTHFRLVKRRVIHNDREFIAELGV